jgi:hypothetical protein
MSMTRSRPLARHGALIVVLVVLVFVALVRLRIADIPLERDEGEYAYAGQLILQGIPPYELAYNMKFPGTYYAYGLILAVFGQTPWGIHVGLLLVNAATTLVIFFLGRRVIGAGPAAAGAATFAVLSLDRWVLGVFAHATHFVLLPAMAGLLVLLRARRSGRAGAFLGAGVLLGTAILMKQHGVFFLAFAIGFLVWTDLRQAARDLPRLVRRIGLVAGGAAVPLTILCAVFAAQGVLGRFWFWTFQYARAYVSEISVSTAWAMFAFALGYVTQATVPIWLVAMAGLAALWLLRWSGDARLFLSGLLAASFIAICPGFYFRPHYFILMLPAVGLLAGAWMGSLDRLLGLALTPTLARALAWVVSAGLLVTYVAREPRYLFSMDVSELSRSLYHTNPFVEAPDIARYLREHTTPDDRIAVLGSEPELYFYANRKSATGYVYTYALTEPQPYASHMQDEMMREVEAAHPKYLVVVWVGTSWTPPSGDARILLWARQYPEKCYDLVGVADVDGERLTLMWDDAARTYQPRSTDVVATYRRKSDAPCGVAHGTGG